MPRPEDRDNIPEHRKLFTPADLLMLYVQEQKPVNSDALRVMIEPLAGTSFGTIALSALRVEFDAQQQRLEPKPYRFLPSQFYHAFFKKIDDSNIDNDLIGTEALHAENALWSFLSHNVAVLSIYPDERLASGEMMFWQQRHDHVWHDPEHERYAFTHDTGQWQFFHNGERVGAGV